MALVALRLQASASPDVGNTSFSKSSVLTEDGPEVPEPPEQAAKVMLISTAMARFIYLTCKAIEMVKSSKGTSA